MEMRGGEWRDEYMQMDGEPWKEPITGEYSWDINNMPFQSLLILGDVFGHHLMPKDYAAKLYVLMNCIEVTTYIE